VAPLPQVDFPTILVTTQLPGASPEIMASSSAKSLPAAKTFAASLACYRKERVSGRTDQQDSGHQRRPLQQQGKVQGYGLSGADDGT
jgi:hypothetical protein